MIWFFCIPINRYKFIFFFFFQAEDGIRDLYVTGVQTCALPISRDFWEVLATFRAAGGAYEGRWFDEKFRKPDDDPDARAERLWEEGRARAIAAKCEGKPGTVSEESKPSTQSSPLLYDLTSLQREA